jgi:hypothetical protein
LDAIRYRPKGNTGESADCSGSGRHQDVADDSSLDLGNEGSTVHRLGPQLDPLNGRRFNRVTKIFGQLRGDGFRALFICIAPQFDFGLALGLRLSLEPLKQFAFGLGFVLRFGLDARGFAVGLTIVSLLLLVLGLAVANDGLNRGLAVRHRNAQPIGGRLHTESTLGRTLTGQALNLFDPALDLVVFGDRDRDHFIGHDCHLDCRPPGPH